jgi:integrase
MARIFKRGETWWMDFTGPNGERVRRASSTDKGVAQAMLGQALKSVEHVRGGMTHADPGEAKRPIEEHIADYIADLNRSGRDARYVYLVERRLKSAKGFGHWHRLKEVNPRTISAYLGKMKTDNRTPKTVNDARSMLYSFFGWCVRQGRMEQNPAEHVERTEDRREKTRRALSVMECRTLIEKAPARRKLIYLTLIYTGLRRSEAKELRWGYLHVDGLNPYVELPATITKSGKAQRVPLMAALADAFRDARGAADDGDKVFRKGMPKMRTFRADLARAGIADEDERGRGVVMHSLRHSLATMLAASGVPMSLAMRIMRHSDVRLTAQTYTDEGLLPLGEAMKSLPALVEPKAEPVVMQATGTDNAVSGFVPTERHHGAFSDSATGGGDAVEIAQRQHPAVVGTIGPNSKKCGRQELNLHGLAATGS